VRARPGPSAAALKLRRHREELQLALKEGISLSAARWRLFLQRHAPANLAERTDRPAFWWQNQ
jgi:hypothetical protein